MRSTRGVSRMVAAATMRSTGRMALAARSQAIVNAATPSASGMRTYASMFCYQCEQTKDSKGCDTVGVCGKTPEVATLQDLLLEGLKAIAQYSHRAAQLGARNAELDAWVKQAMFATLTNVNFDAARFQQYLAQASRYRDMAKALYTDACKQNGVKPETLSSADAFQVAAGESVDSLVQKGERVGVMSRRKEHGDTLAGLMELVTYGLKGMAAYADHAHVYGMQDAKVDAFVHEVLNELAQKPTVDSLLGYALKVGSTNIRVMEMLDECHTTRYGHPEPTKVRTSAIAGKAILVSGHDIRDLEEVLKQTQGQHINVYTHGELLPAHAYPELKNKYPHLVGNYGGAWQQQQLEFSIFPGPILMTTNCIVEPRKAYRDRIYTRSVVGWPGVKHLESFNDFSELVAKAKAMDGFAKDEPASYTMTGFGRNAVLSNAGTIVEAVKAGAVKHFFLIGGCDGAETERSYFRDLAKAVPQDAMILTLACGKYRFNKMFEKFGNIGPFPRMLDMGQCNDAYSAIQVAAGLAKAFNTDVNGLPLSFAISWFEQKAVAVLLSLLSLNIKNIHLGPRLPAFITPDALKVLVDTFEIKPTTSVEVDMKHYMPN